MKNESNKKKKVSANMLMNLAENAKGANLYAGLHPFSQQILLDRYDDPSEEGRKKRVREQKE